MKQKLLKALPKKYHERVANFESEDGLIDDCKYMLYLNDGHHFWDGGNSIPCKNVKEAIGFVKECYVG